MNVIDFLPEATRHDPLAIGLRWQSLSHSYADLATASAEASRILQAAKSDTTLARVALAVPNRAPFLPLLQATWESGAEAVLISGALPPATAGALAERHDVDVLVVPESVDPAAYAGWAGGLVVAGPSLKDLRVAHVGTPTATHPPRTPGVVMFTSGTTGNPKAVTMSAGDISAAIDRTLSQFGAHAGNAQPSASSGPPPSPQRADNLIVFPLYHVSGLFQLLLSLRVRRPVALMERFTVEAFVSALEQEPVFHVVLNPAMIAKLIGDPAERVTAAVGRLTSVRSGASPLPEPIRASFEARFGVPILQSYGSTETIGEIASMSVRDRQSFGETKKASVGRPHRTATVEVRDTQGRSVAPGTSGEIWVSAGGAATAFHSLGDVGYLDDDGFLYVTGRTDDIINCGGFKIHPATVERLLHQCSGVADSAVIGEADVVLGEVPVAYIVTVGDTSPTDLDGYLRQHLAPYQCPRRFVFVDELPRNELGKLVRKAVTTHRG